MNVLQSVGYSTVVVLAVEGAIVVFLKFVVGLRFVLEAIAEKRNREESAGHRVE